MDKSCSNCLSISREIDVMVWPSVTSSDWPWKESHMATVVGYVTVTRP